jgi:DNA polymerase IV
VPPSLLDRYISDGIATASIRDSQMENQKPPSKEEFFKELYYESSEDERRNSSMKASKTILRRTRTEPAAVVATISNKDKNSKRENGSSLNNLPPLTVPMRADTLDTTTNESRIQSLVQSGPALAGLVRNITQPHVHSALHRNTITATRMPKRKKYPANEVPAAEQLFRGKKFFFLPDDDIAKGRKLRIEKAQQYGAEWVRSWSSDITHIIVDKGINYNDILKYLKVSALPDGVVLVNEIYPAQCITYRHMVNDKQPQYQVEGYEGALEATAKAVEAEKAAQTTQLPTSHPTDDTNPSSMKSPSSDISSLMVKRDKRRTEKTPSVAGDSAESAASREARFIANERGTLHSYEPARKTDALDEAISQARELAGLPLDVSEAEESEGLSDESGTDDESLAQKRKRRKLDGEKPGWQENLSCMKKSDGADGDQCPNADTIEVLQKMYDYYERMQDQWRTLAYRKAIAALRCHKERIVSKKQAAAIPYIGERLAQKIEEIVWTGRLRRLESTTLEPNDEALQTFLNIYGVGYKLAATFVAKGFRTLEDLKSRATLSKNQVIGVEHYDDFLARIPREETGRHARLVRSVLEKINPNIEVTVGGSYRRGAATSGDIDYIITARDTPMPILRDQILNEMMPRLWALRYLRCCLAETSSVDGTKWHGAAVLPGSQPAVWRRVDFLLVPYEEFGAALIYFTGNDIFNRSIRLLASKKGMRLNQRGLWKDVMRGPEKGRVTQGTLVEAQSEKIIFAKLGVPWRSPVHRNC